MIGTQVMLRKGSSAASARLDREFAGGNPKGWWREMGRRIHIAIVRRIPVGFEDETGFHPGVQQVSRDERMDWERASLLWDEKQF